VTGGKQKHKHNPTMLKICSWNVRGLNRPGKLAIIENNVNNIAITGLSETHWKEIGNFTTSNGNLVILSGNEQESINSVAIIVKKHNIKNTVIGYST